MILLDTNVVSEMMRPEPSARVVQWLAAQDVPELRLSSISVAEIHYGLHNLPEGKRRRTLWTAFDNVLTELFQNQILGFDLKAAESYGQIMSDRRSSGRPMSALDGQIAAIALSQRACLATRNAKDFRDLGLMLLDPFEPADTT